MSENVYISVVIPVYNEAVAIGQCIESVMRQSCPPERYEVIVVDNNSTDNTKEVIGHFMEKYPERIRYLLELQQGAAFARNAGIHHSKGEIIAFTDGDCVVSDNWLANFSKVFGKKGVDAVQGKIVLATKPEKYDDVITEDIIRQMFAHVDYGAGTFRLPPERDMVSANMAIRKNVIMTHGLFDNAFAPCEDTELSRRYEKAGVQRFYCSDAYIEHRFSYNRMSQKSILRQCYRWGRVSILLKDYDVSETRYGVYLLKAIIRDVFKLFIAMCVSDKHRVFSIKRALIVDCGQCAQLLAISPKALERVMMNADVRKRVVIL